MIAWLARRLVERAYRWQNGGDLDRLLLAFAPDAVFEFHGDTPFGHERRGREAIRQWFEQVASDFGRLELRAEEVTVSGPPWNMRLVIRFRDRYRLISGHSLENYGFQYLRLRWGRIVEERILVDLDIVRYALALIGDARESAQ